MFSFMIARIIGCVILVGLSLFKVMHTAAGTRHSGGIHGRGQASVYLNLLAANVSLAHSSCASRALFLTEILPRYMP